MGYAIGQLGWSTLINIIGIQLVYFYIPPENSGLPVLITQATFLVVLNALSLIAASGRLWDAVTDPLIASFSDRSKNPRGRRIPFMAKGALPSAVFCFLMFFPPDDTPSTMNIVWIVVTQTLFYLFLTVYVTPFFALLPELGHTADERLNLSTYISVTYALGIIIAAQAPGIAGALKNTFALSTVKSFQFATGGLAVLAVLAMYVPVFMIDEKKYSNGKPSDIPLFKAIRKTFKNKNFIAYVIADFCYFAALSIIMTGLLFYVTVLLLPEDVKAGEALVGTLLGVMVIVSFVFYPAVNFLAKRFGKKPLILGAFFFYGLVFLTVFILGKSYLTNLVSPTSQAFLLIILSAIPISFLGILPNAVLADIAEHDGQMTGERKEGMFFAARTLMQKFGQTFGILVFAGLTTFGKDPGNDLGIRLSGVAGFLLAVFAVIAFWFYKEKTILRELKENSK
ncbi:MAG: MFS transporter [Leptospiraceae bacterium]|nr:MFS transporter [Leptospiraceae bacterium]